MSISKLADALRNNDWVKDAACRDLDPDLFFVYHEAGKSYCNGGELSGPCPVREECLTYALEANERYGVWGGLDEVERRSLKRELRYRRKIREQVAQRVEHERANGHCIRTETRVVVRRGTLYD